ncbi:MAG: N-formylglutamate deformylase [Aestuariivirga sp.]
MIPFDVKEGRGPIILCQPHGSTFVPAEIWTKLNDNGRKLADTDWHIGRLYDGLRDDVTVVSANFHRYVIDANRDPSGATLYPGQNTTGLCPLTDFNGSPIYQSGAEPDDAEIARHLEQFHKPYHAAVLGQVGRVKAQHGFAIIYDCHSIRSQIPHLFEGTLPDLNIGTDNGKTCAKAIEQHVLEIAKASGFTSVLNGRFRGGWTTRHYGRPAENVHAIQMEISQSAYLESEAAPWNFYSTKAAMLRPNLAKILNSLESALP